MGACIIYTIAYVYCAEGLLFKGNHKYEHHQIIHVLLRWVIEEVFKNVLVSVGTEFKYTVTENIMNTSSKLK